MMVPSVYRALVLPCHAPTDALSCCDGCGGAGRRRWRPPCTVLRELNDSGPHPAGLVGCNHVSQGRHALQSGACPKWRLSHSTTAAALTASARGHLWGAMVVGGVETLVQAPSAAGISPRRPGAQRLDHQWVSTSSSSRKYRYRVVELWGCLQLPRLLVELEACGLGCNRRVDGYHEL